MAPDGSFAVGGTTFGDYDPDPGADDATVAGGGQVDGFAAVYGPDRALRFAVPFGPPARAPPTRCSTSRWALSGELAVVGQVGDVLDLDPGPSQTLIEAPGFAVYVFVAV